MSFAEKSAWGLLGGLVAVSVMYFPAAFRLVAAVDHGAPLIGLIAAGTAVLVFVEIVYHAVIAAADPKNADVVDERDRLIDLKAERNGGLVLGAGLFWLVGWILAASVLPALGIPGALEIAVWIMLAITVSEIAKLCSQVAYYRRGT